MSRGVRPGRSLEGTLVLAAAVGVALFMAATVAVSIYSAFVAAANRIEAVTQPR